MKEARRLHATEVDGRRRRKLCRHVQRENASGQMDGLTLALWETQRGAEQTAQPLNQTN